MPQPTSSRWTHRCEPAAVRATLVHCRSMVLDMGNLLMRGSPQRCRGSACRPGGSVTSVVRPAIPGPSGPLPLTEPHGPPRSGRTALVPNTGRLYVRAKAAFKGEYAIDASVTTDGNEAAARVAYRLSDVIAIYPITRLPDGRAR